MGVMSKSSMALTRQFFHGLVRPHHSRRDFIDSDGRYTLVACSCGKVWLGTEEAYLKREQAEANLERLLKMGSPFRKEDFDAIDRLKTKCRHNVGTLDEDKGVPNE